MRPRNLYKGDPYWIKARFTSYCSECHRVIKTGKKIFYYPKTKDVFCEKCGESESRQFESAAADECFYNNQY